jgi:hypothetical protein
METLAGTKEGSILLQLQCANSTSKSTKEVFNVRERDLLQTRYPLWSKVGTILSYAWKN